MSVLHQRREAAPPSPCMSSTLGGTVEQGTGPTCALCLPPRLRRKSQQTHRSALGSSALSSEDEDGFYDSNITSILSESHLQTSNC